MNIATAAPEHLHDLISPAAAAALLDPDTAVRIIVRAVEEALAEAEPLFWRRRAATLEAAAPRPADFRGQATSAELAAAGRRCREAAAVCRAKALVLDAARLDVDVLDMLDPPAPEVAA